MKYVVDDKKLDAVPFIAFVNQVWQGSYDVEKTQGAFEVFKVLTKGRKK